MNSIPRPPPTSPSITSPSSALLSPDYEAWKKSSVSPVLLTTLAELARVAARGVSTEALLTELTQLTMLATTVDGVGTMSCADTTVTFVHADSPRTAIVDRLQERLQEGPCRTSVQTQKPIAVTDFAEPSAGRQWPGLAPAALEAGLHSTLAVPMLARGRAWGVLDIYRDRPHRWTFADLLVSKTLADVVVSLLVLATDLERARAGHGGRGESAAGRAVGADRLRATLDARLERLNTRLSAARNQAPPTD